MAARPWVTSASSYLARFSGVERERGSKPRLPGWRSGAANMSVAVSWNLLTRKRHTHSTLIGQQTRGIPHPHTPACRATASRKGASILRSILGVSSRQLLYDVLHYKIEKGACPAHTRSVPATHTQPPASRKDSLTSSSLIGGKHKKSNNTKNHTNVSAPSPKSPGPTSPSPLILCLYYHRTL